jgi:Mrp family chromosome partitioning ATPase/capsular polysaccharide biosynthesis protein
MELSDVTIALRRHWMVAVLAMLFWVLVGAAMAFLPEGRYRASASLLVAPSTQLGASSVQVANFQIPGIVAVLESSTFARKVEATLPKNVADASISIHADVSPGSGIIRVRTEGTDPKAAAAWATALVNQILDEPVTLPELVQTTVLDQASVPRAPFSPKRLPIFLGTAILGPISAIVASAVMYRARKALNVVEEVERRLGVPVIGRIPWVRPLQHASPFAAADLLVSTPRLTEAFQTLRTNLELAFLGTPTDSQVVAIASWGEGVGKSTIAAGLALTSAQSGTEVLAVDADLRRPELHTRLGEPFGPGTADAGRRELERLVFQTRQRRLWLLRAGTSDRHPADVLAVVLERILGFAKGKGWRVVIDAPPYHGIAETAMVLSAARYVVLVVDARRSKLPELESMASRLQASGVNIVGVTLNRVPKSRMDAAYGPYAPKATRTRPASGPRRAAAPVRSAPREVGTSRETS